MLSGIILFLFSIKCIIADFESSVVLANLELAKRELINFFLKHAIFDPYFQVIHFKLEQISN